MSINIRNRYVDERLPQQNQMAQQQMAQPQQSSGPFGFLQGMFGMGQQQAAPMPLPPQAYPPQQTRNDQSIVSRGINSGIGAARESLEMDEEQKRIALGNLISNMFGRMSQSEQVTDLGRINEGLAYGLRGYQQDRAQMAEMNSLNRQRQDKLAREQYDRDFKEREFQARRDQHSERMGLLKQRSGMSENGDVHTKILQEKGLIPENSVSFKDMSKQDIKNVRTEISKEIKDERIVNELINEYKRAKKILEENPDLGNSWAVQQFDDDNKHNKTLEVYALGKNRVPFERMRKSTARAVMLQSGLSGGSSRATDMVRKLTAEAKFRPSLSKEANETIIDNGIKDLEAYKKYIHERKKGESKGYKYIDFGESGSEIEPQKPSGMTDSSSQSQQQVNFKEQARQYLSQPEFADQVRKLRTQANIPSNYTDEQIAEALLEEQGEF